MKNKYFDVLVIGGGPAGLYASLILKKGTPMQVPNEPIKVGLLESNKIGGLARYAFIQITKKWAFSGGNLIQTLYSEAYKAGVVFFEKEKAEQIIRQNNNFCVVTNKEKLYSKYVVISTGILTFPTVLDTPQKTNIGLHTPKAMIDEAVNEYKWKSILVVGSEKTSISNLTKELKKDGRIEKIDYALIPEEVSPYDRYFGLKKAVVDNFDGLLFDYNSYKLKNGSTIFLKSLKITQKNGYVVVNNLGETLIPGLFAIGSVCMPISGVPAAIASAQITAFYIGHLLEKTTVADPSGRFPFFPREQDWYRSFQSELENKYEKS